MSDLIDCQKIVEWMLSDGRALAEVEDSVRALRARRDGEGGIVDAGLGAPGPGDTTATCQRDARARQQYAKPTGVRSEGAPGAIAQHGLPASGLIDKAARHRDSCRVEAQRFDDRCRFDRPMKVKGLGRGFGVDLADRLVGVEVPDGRKRAPVRSVRAVGGQLARMRLLFARGSASSGLVDVGTAR